MYMYITESFFCTPEMNTALQTNYARVCAKSLQSCLTLHHSMHCSLPGSSVYGILQARILEWVVLRSSRGSSQHRIKPASPVL